MHEMELITERCDSWFQELTFQATSISHKEGGGDSCMTYGTRIKIEENNLYAFTVLSPVYHSIYLSKISSPSRLIPCHMPISELKESANLTSIATRTGTTVSYDSHHQYKV